MRKLNFSDCFKFGRLAAKTSVIEKIVSATTNIDNITQAQAGLEILGILVENATTPEIENMIYEFIASLTEKETEEIKNLDLFQIGELFKEMLDFNGVDGLKSFFKQAFSSQKMETLET